MDWVMTTAVVVGLVLVGSVVAWCRELARVRDDLRHQIEVGGLRCTLPEAWWMLRRAGCDPGLDRVDRSTPGELGRHLSRHLEEPVGLHQLHRRADELNQELRTVVVNQQSMPRMAQVFDVAAISLGGAVAAANIDAVDAAFSTAGGLVGAGVEYKARVLGEMFPDAVEGLADAAGGGVQMLADPMTNALSDGVMPVPVGSMIAGGRRLLRGIDHGISGGRIAENAGLDLGVQGGATVTGGLLGSFLVPIPIVGTMVGSVVGGLVGATVAGAARGRHLARARELWMARLAGFGEEVDAADFQHLVSLMDRSLRVKREALAGLRRSTQGPRKLWPTYGAAFRRELMASAERDVNRSVLERQGVKECVELMGRAESASRALLWFRYGEPNKSPNMRPLLEAANQYREEHLSARALS